MGKKQKCLLQVSAKYRFTLMLIEKQLNWRIIENKHDHYLIEFMSKSDRKEFVKIFCGGKMLGRNMFMVKFSPYPDVPLGYISNMPNEMEIKHNYVIFPSLARLNYYNQELFNQLDNLYGIFGADLDGDIMEKSICIKRLIASKT